MAARRTLVEDLILLACRLPWQAATAMALGSWVVLHFFARAGSTPLHPQALTQLGSVYAHTLFGVMAYLLQFVIPSALLIGAALSAWRRFQANRWLEKSAADSAALAPLTAAQFEQLVAQYFRRQKFSATEQILGGADGGIDVTLTRGPDRFLVQCKHWRTRAVGPSVVRELNGVIAARGGAGGYVVTSGSFTAAARAFAAEAGIHLVDGIALRSGAAVPATPAATFHSSEHAARSNAPVSPSSPSCPHCGRAMARRTAGRGRHVGKDFWGCTGFPNCRGILSI